MTQARYLTIEQAAAAAGVSTREAARWVAKATANRFRRTKRQGRYWFRADIFIAWLQERDWPERAAQVEAWCVANAGGELPAPPPKPRRATRRLPAMPPGDMDIFRTRDLIAGMLVDNVAAYRTATAAEIAASSKAVRELADLQRKLEIDCLEVDAKLHRVIPMAAVEKIVGRMLSEARTNLQTLRYAMVDDLAAMTDRDAIAKYLDDRFAASLRSLEESYLAAEVAAYLPEG